MAPVMRGGGGERVVDYVAEKSYTVTLAVSLGQIQDADRESVSHDARGDPGQRKSAAGLPAGGNPPFSGLEDWHDIIADLEDAWKWSDRKTGRDGCNDSPHPADDCWIFAPGSYESVIAFLRRMTNCAINRGCSTTCRRLADDKHVASSHFTGPSLEKRASAEKRRRDGPWEHAHERQRESWRFITETGSALARVATAACT